MKINRNHNDKLSDLEYQETKITSMPITIARVTICPSSPDHGKCSRFYADANQKYIVKCECKCHGGK